MKAHRTDGLSLTFGLIFLAATAWWLLAQVVDLSLPNAGWFVAGALILLGALGLIGALRGNQAPAKEPGPTANQAAPTPNEAGPTATESGPTMEERPATAADNDVTRDLLKGGEGEPDGPSRGLPAG
jgi:hypothetical protein